MVGQSLGSARRTDPQWSNGHYVSEPSSVQEISRRLRDPVSAFLTPLERKLAIGVHAVPTNMTPAASDLSPPGHIVLVACELEENSELPTRKGRLRACGEQS